AKYVMNQAKTGTNTKRRHLSTCGEQGQACALLGSQLLQLGHRLFQFSSHFGSLVLTLENFTQQLGVAHYATQQVFGVWSQVQGRAIFGGLFKVAGGTTAKGNRVGPEVFDRREVRLKRTTSANQLGIRRLWEHARQDVATRNAL